MKKIISKMFAAVLIFTTLLNAQNTEMDNDAARFYNEGNKLMKSGDYEGAVSKYNAALKTSSDYRIHYQKGVTLKKLGNFTEAETSFAASVKNNPSFDIGYNGLGGTYFAEGKYLEAAESFKKFEELTKKKKLKNKAKEYIARSYSKLAETSKADGRYDEAINYLTQAVNYHDYDAAYLALAELYVETAQYEKALEAADKALNNRKSITRGGPYYYKGLAFKGKNDMIKAKENFESGKKDSKYKSLCEYELKLMK